MELDGTIQVHIHGDLQVEMTLYTATPVILARQMQLFVYVGTQRMVSVIDVETRPSPIQHGKRLYIMLINQRSIWDD
jgi:hypothetical protein